MSERPPFRFYSPGELSNLPPLRWVAQGVIPTGGKVMVFGQPEAGKTAVTMSMALGIASGQAEWFGLPLSAGLVVYCGTEGTSGLNGRVGAWLEANPGARPQILFVPDPVTLTANSPGMEGSSDRE